MSIRFGQHDYRNAINEATSAPMLDPFIMVFDTFEIQKLAHVSLDRGKCGQVEPPRWNLITVNHGADILAGYLVSGVNRDRCS